jgi:hypothetical protein
MKGETPQTFVEQPDPWPSHKSPRWRGRRNQRQEGRADRRGDRRRFGEHLRSRQTAVAHAGDSHQDDRRFERISDRGRPVDRERAEARHGGALESAGRVATAGRDSLNHSALARSELSFRLVIRDGTDDASDNLSWFATSTQVVPCQRQCHLAVSRRPSKSRSPNPSPPRTRGGMRPPNLVRKAEATEREWDPAAERQAMWRLAPAALVVLLIVIAVILAVTFWAVGA